MKQKDIIGISKSEVYLILISLCFLIYANSLNNAFVSDDIPGIVNNGRIGELFHSPFEPAVILYSFNYLLGKLTPFIYHLTNTLLHALNAILVFSFLLMFFKIETALLGAALFAVHPANCEAVAWVSGRPYLMRTLFLLISYFIYEKADYFNSAGRKIKGGAYLFLTAILFLYLTMSDFLYFFFIPFIMLLDFIFKRWKRTWKLWVPFLILSVTRLFLIRSLINARIEFVAQNMSQDPRKWTNPLFNMVYSFFAHLWLYIFPKRLTIYHEPHIISPLNLGLGIAVFVIIFCFLPYVYKKSRKSFLALGLVVLFLGHTYSPVPIAWLFAERYLYLPSIGLSMFACLLYERFHSDKLKRIASGIFIFIISAYAVRTVARNEDWKSEERFWRQTALVSDQSPRSYNNLGYAYGKEGNVAMAIQSFNKAIALKPDYADAYHNLANIYHSAGNIEEALRFYKKATECNDGLFEAHLNLGLIYVEQQSFDLAREQLTRALEIRPGDYNALAALELLRQKRR